MAKRCLPRRLVETLIICIMQAEGGTFISDFANIPTPPNLILSTYENITRRLQRQKI